jgi:hypothetical protein
MPVVGDDHFDFGVPLLLTMVGDDHFDFSVPLLLTMVAKVEERTN